MDSSNCKQVNATAVRDVVIALRDIANKYDLSMGEAAILAHHAAAILADHAGINLGQSRCIPYGELKKGQA